MEGYPRTATARRPAAKKIRITIVTVVPSFPELRTWRVLGPIREQLDRERSKLEASGRKGYAVGDLAEGKGGNKEN